MGHLSVFFNTEIQDSGFLSAIGDFGLTPVRYLFNGNKVLIEENDEQEVVGVHHVQSFHYSEFNFSTSTTDLESSTASMLKCIGLIVGLVPGFFLCIFKAFAYFSADTREDHRLAKLHFTPIDRTIGTPENPIDTLDKLDAAYKNEREEPLHRLTNTLTIHGNGSLELTSAFAIDVLNPKKVILQGATVGNQTDYLILNYLKTSNWKVINPTTSRDAPTTLDEARDYTPPTKGCLTTERWQVLIEIQ